MSDPMAALIYDIIVADIGDGDATNLPHVRLTDDGWRDLCAQLARRLASEAVVVGCGAPCECMRPAGRMALRGVRA